MNSPEEQKEITLRFIDEAERQALVDYERALRRIASLPASEATMIAEEALGIGPYWQKGFGRVPRTYLGYLWAKVKLWWRFRP